MKNEVLAMFCVLLFAVSAAAEEVDFPHQIVPILRAKCMVCHVGDEPEGDFSINTRRSLIQSEHLLDKITSDDAKVRMPPPGEPQLLDSEKELLAKWVESGTRWTTGFTFDGVVYQPPLRPRKFDLPDPVDGNDHPIDRVLDNEAIDHNLPVGDQIADAVFVRRVFLDLVGLLPTIQQATKFIDDTSDSKRTKLVDQLLSDETAYAEHWITFWNDSLGNDYVKSHPRKQISGWLYESLLSNKPYDEMARELIAPPSEDSSGFGNGTPPSVRSEHESIEMQYAKNVAQTFLGINLHCASCHDSYLDDWTVEDTFSLAAIKATRGIQIETLGKSTGKFAKPKWLFSEIGKLDDFGPHRQRLNDFGSLVTDAENGRFARTIVNRLWQQLFGRGISHPTTTLNEQPFSEDLLDLLANHLIENDYDLKSVLRLIATSKAYGRKTAELTSAAMDETNTYHFAGPMQQPMTAEQYLDAVWSVTQSAPQRYDAPFLRTNGTQKTDDSEAGSDTETSNDNALAAKWIWGDPYSKQSGLTDGSTFVVRKTVDLAAPVRHGVAFVTADNSMELYLNGQFAVFSNHWSDPEVVLMRDILQEGKNEIVIVVHQHLQEREKSAAVFEARLELENGETHHVISDDSWDVMQSDKPLERDDILGKLGSIKSAAKIFQRAESYEQITRQSAMEVFNQYSLSRKLPVRASLLENSDLMRALGRPDRLQPAAERDSNLDAFGVIDWSDPVLAKALSHGSKLLVEQHAQDPSELVRQAFLAAFSRLPSKTEQADHEAAFDSERPNESTEALLRKVFVMPEFMMAR